MRTIDGYLVAMTHGACDMVFAFRGLICIIGWSIGGLGEL